jgi:protocatechuate 3,4-dioxygenase beta subunit
MLIVRSRLTLLAWILAGVSPLLLLWALFHPPQHPPQAPERRVATRRGPAPVELPPPLESSQSLTLTGEVVDAEGRPVAAVVVTLIDPEGRGDVLAPGRSRELRDRETRTDGRGEFRFAGLSPGRRMLVARLEDRPPAWSDPFLVERSLHQTLKLPAPVSLAGVTRSHAALTFSVRIPGVPPTGHRPVTVAASADETGAYRVDGLPPAATFDVHVQAASYRPRLFGPYQFPSGHYHLDFDLDTGLTLRGTVRDVAGRPVAGAQVCYDDARSTTAADGTFQVSGLEERSTTLIVSREGHITTVLPSLRPGSVDVTLPRAAEVMGSVSGGRGCYICFTVGDARYRLGLGDSEKFRIPAVPPGPLRLEVEDEERRVLGSAVVDAPEGGSVEGVEILLR